MSTAEADSQPAALLLHNLLGCFTENEILVPAS
jgi:hypothetical protein